MQPAIHDELQEVFRRVFGDSQLTIRPATQAKDVPGWDSVTHLNLIVAIEQRFRVRFHLAEISGFRNVGGLEAALVKKLAAPEKV